MSAPIQANADARLDPARHQLLEAYSTWLFYERRMACIELAGGDKNVADQFESGVPTNAGSQYFFSGPKPRFATQPASERAQAVLSAVGCNWRKEG